MSFGLSATAIGVGGALLGAIGSSKGQSQTQNSTREPWGPAQDWIKSNMANGQQLQGWYQQHPFNALQQAGYQNTFTDADQFRAQVLPGLLDFANDAMGGQYQRQRGGSPGAGAGYGGAVVPGGYKPGTGRVFALAPGQRFGTVDWAGLNPYADTKAGTGQG